MQVQEGKGADRGWCEIQSSLTWHFTPSLLSTYCMPVYDLWYKSLLAGENQLDGDWWGGGTPALMKVRDKASLTWASGSASGETSMDSRQILEFELTGAQQKGRGANGKKYCTALNFYKIIIEPYREDSTNE